MNLHVRGFEKHASSGFCLRMMYIGGTLVNLQLQILTSTPASESMDYSPAHAETGSFYRSFHHRIEAHT